MGKNFFLNFAITAVLIIIQVLICNHIMLFNVAMAFIFIYMIIRLPVDLKTDWLLTWAFFSGLVVDIFSDTPGVNALACTLLAIIKKPMLFAYVPRDDRTKNITPSLKELGFSVYGKYLLTMLSSDVSSTANAPSSMIRRSGVSSFCSFPRLINATRLQSACASSI